MTFLEKNSWVYGITAVLGFILYLTWVLILAQQHPIVEVNYVLPMVSIIIGTILLNILISIVMGIASAKRDTREDERDREISRRGDYRGFLVVVIGATGALLLSFFEQPHFWIANAIYLSFVLSAIVAVVVKVLGYRRGF